MKRPALLASAWLAALAFAAGACSTTDKGLGDAGSESRIDGGAADLDATDGVGQPSSGLGSPCRRDDDCPSDLFCDEEITSTLQVPGTPKGVVQRSLFPGGSCSPRPLGPYDPASGGSCDLEAAPDEQGCGVGGVCVIEDTDPSLLVSCRVACEPRAESSGCAREGYTCDFRLRACVEGCVSDAECRLSQIDSDADGFIDAIAYDTDSTAFCDLATARCGHEGGASESGGACRSDGDCESDGICLTADSTVVGNTFPDGYCTKVGCEIEGRECNGEASACVSLRSLSEATTSVPVCMTTCRVGAEPEDDRLGPGGHGEGCRPGYRCQYNGGGGAAAGVCVGGIYNGIDDNNVGEACSTDRDCYSPYGIGLCLSLEVGGITPTTGTCSMLDCAAPGLPDDVCGGGNACLGLSGDVTFCAKECTAAEECARGHACADDDADPATPSICYPVCFTDEECRERQACELSAVGAGQCVALPGTD